MTKHLLIPFLLAGLSVCGFAQNQAPVITNLNAVVNWSTNILTLQYGVTDAENDPLEISVFFSSTGGKTYNITGMVNASGDVGFPVTPGANHLISCDVSQLAGMGASFTVRLVAIDHQPFDLQQLVNSVDSNRLRSDLEWVQGIRHRSTGAAHLAAVRDSIRHVFSKAGLYQEDHSFVYSGYTGLNLIGTAPGVSTAEKVVVVDAHYDTVSNAPGADDNGSGTVAVWEIARLLSPYPSLKTLRYIGFDLEESGLIGSTRYVSNGIPAGEQIDGVFNFEMIGYYSNQPNTQTLPTGFNLLFPAAYNTVTANQNRGDFITNVANVNSATLSQAFQTAAAQYVPGLKVISLDVPGNGEIAPDLRRSDHTPFWTAGSQALMLSDGANFRNLCYHSPCDTLEDKLDFTFMSQVTQATLAAAANYAGIQHGNWTSATFQGLVRTQEPENCDVTAFSTPGRRDQIQIKTNDCLFSDLQIALYDAKGALMAEKTMVVLPQSLQSWQVSDLKPGIYVVKITSLEGAKVQKLVVE